MGNQASKVSIIIPTYNRSNDLIRCLNSLREQTYKNFEVLVCDDGSTDDTFEILSKFIDVFELKYFKNDNFGGPAKSRNLGIQNSSGDYIAFLDSDDWWLPEKLERSLEYLEKGADLVYHDLWIFGTNGIPRFFNKAKSRAVGYPIYTDLLMNGNAINNSSVVVRKSVINKVGLLSEDKNLIAWEDYEYWLRISKITNQFLRVPECLGFYWIGGGNISNPERTLRINELIKGTYKTEFIDYYGKSNKYPSWIEYSYICAKLDLGQLSLNEFFISIDKLTYRFLIKIFYKWIIRRVL